MSGRPSPAIATAAPTGPPAAPVAAPLALAAPAALALLLAAAYLLAPRLGTDLSAAVARADFARAHGLRPVDLRWYGGTNQFGYSLLSPWLVALAGARVAGALAGVAGTLALAALLVRTRVRRPVLGALAGALCLFGNLASGRIAFALGLAFGLLALLLLSHARPAAAAAAAVLAAATSPVAGLFAGLVAVALLFTGRRRDALALGVAAAVPLAVVGLLFGEGGYNGMSRADLLHALVLSVAVAVLGAPGLVRAGGLLSALGLVAAYAVHTPVGLNATRLAVVFALPVLVATAPLRLPVLVPVALALALYAPPVLTGDLRDAGNPTSDPAYFRPLVAELARRAPVGRVEVPPTRDYWEAAYVTRAVPLARGWLRQADTERNPLFFDGSLSDATYLAWLRDNGVQYVALPDARPAFVGRPEADLVRGGPAYLSEVWRGRHWVLYAVAGAPSLVTGPGHLVGSDGGGATVAADAPGALLVRVRFSRWLVVDGGGCLRPDGRWIELVVARAGTYRISSALRPRGTPCQGRHAAG